MSDKKDGQLWLANTKNAGDFDNPFLCVYRIESNSGFCYVDVYESSGNYDADDLDFIELIRDVDASIRDLQNQIHTALLELCAIADENDQILEVDIRTVYLNSAGKVQCNAVLECNVTMIDKGEL